MVRLKSDRRSGDERREVKNQELESGEVEDQALEISARVCRRDEGRCMERRDGSAVAICDQLSVMICVSFDTTFRELFVIKWRAGFTGNWQLLVIVSSVLSV